MNSKHLTNIFKVEQQMMVHCNVGISTTNQRLMCDKFGVRYNPYGIAVVISLKTTVACYEVTYTSKDRGGMFIMHTSKGKVEFLCHPRRLHNLDLSQKKNVEIMLAMTLI